MPILRGRNFTSEDTATSQQVVLVNQAFARHFFPNQDPIGKHFGVDKPAYSGAFQIVGVFGNFRMTNKRGDDRPIFLRPLSQQFTGYKEADEDAAEKHSMFMSFTLLHFSQTPMDAEGMARRTLAAIDPNLTVIHFDTYDAEVAGNFNQDRLIARLTSMFGILALILASVGLYGVMSYFVARRTSEIGLRMALGASRPGVVAMVLRSALWQIVVGLALGVPAALLAGHLMTNLLYDVSGYDPLALVGAILALAVCATLAGFVPARRAASIEPMKALRAD